MSICFAGRYFNKHKQFFTYDYGDYNFKNNLDYGELYLKRLLIKMTGIL